MYMFMAWHVMFLYMWKCFVVLGVNKRKALCYQANAIGCHLSCNI